MKKLLLLLLLSLSFNSYAYSVEPSPVIEIEVPVYMCGDLVVDFDEPDKPDETDKPDEILLIDGIEYIEVKDVGWFVEKPVLIDLEPDDPRCEKPIYNHLDEEPTVNPKIVYVVREIVAFLCGDLIISFDTPDITSNEEVVIDTLSYIKLEPDDPRCIEAKKNND
jgi:hypothetical protein